MKTIITVTICIGLLVVSGCGQNVDWSAVGEQWNENYQRQLDRQAYGRPQIQLGPVIYPSTQQGNQSTHWQERYHEQKYWEDWRRQRGLPPYNR